MIKYFTISPCCDSSRRKADPHNVPLRFPLSVSNAEYEIPLLHLRRPDFLESGRLHRRTLQWADDSCLPPGSVVCSGEGRMEAVSVNELDWARGSGLKAYR